MKFPRNATFGSKPRFPLQLDRRGASIKVYRIEQGGRRRYRLTWYEGAVRRFLMVSSVDEAEREADAKLEALATGDPGAARFTGSERATLIAAKRHLAGLEGATVDLACRDYAAAVKALADHGTLESAVKYYLRHHGGQIVRKAVMEVVEEFLEDRRSRGVSLLHLRDAGHRLRRFAGDFHCPWASVTRSDIEAWLKARPVGATSRNNDLKCLHALGVRCLQQGFATQNPADGITRWKQPPKEIGIFTPAELKALLKAAGQYAVIVAIQAFTGVRAQELVRLRWRDIGRDQKDYIEVAAHKSKTAARRLVPLGDALQAWLTVSSKGHDDDPVWPFSRDHFFKTLAAITLKAGVCWKHNGLRHSYISYRLALLKSAAEVALEAGDSAQMVFRHYRELVHPTEAAKWFNMSPAVLAIDDDKGSPPTVSLDENRHQEGAAA